MATMKIICERMRRLSNLFTLIEMYMFFESRQANSNFNKYNLVQGYWITSKNGNNIG